MTPTDVLAWMDPVRLAASVRETLRRHATIALRFRPVTSGFSGLRAALIETGEGTIFVKWAHDDATAVSLAREAYWGEQLREHVTGARVLRYDEVRRVLVLEGLDAHAVDWSSAVALDDAGTVLDRFAVVAPALVIACPHPTGVQFARHPSSTPETVLLDSCSDLADCAMQFSDLRADVLAHCDAHSENWLRHGDELRLVDLDHVGLAPRGFDSVYLACHLEHPERAPWLRARVEGDELRVMAGAVTYWLACMATQRVNDPFARRSAVYLERARRLYDDLSG